jgi:hypothetical protein
VRIQIPSNLRKITQNLHNINSILLVGCTFAMFSFDIHFSIKASFIDYICADVFSSNTRIAVFSPAILSIRVVLVKDFHSVLLNFKQDGAERGSVVFKRS